jgi:glycosyltransferase involved in cell wall biosynthesis
MRLGIISDARHYMDAEGRVHTLAILAGQFEVWAEMFDEVLICAPLLPGAPPADFRAYSRPNIRLVPVEEAGGSTLRAKWNLFRKVPAWWMAIRRMLERVDAVHVRCPNNVSIPGLLAVARSGRLRQAVYTGVWNGPASATYRLQRWYLRRRFRGPVAVYASGEDLPAHLVPTFSPSYSAQVWDEESAAVGERLARLEDHEAVPRRLRIVTVGRLTSAKGQATVLRAVALLSRSGVAAEVHMVGEGPDRGRLERLAEELGLADAVVLHGALPPEQVRALYRRADFVVQAPTSEGYGKVPVEAFFHGAVPVLSDIGMSREIVGGTERGRVFPPGDEAALAAHLVALASDAAEVARLVRAGREYARGRTLEAWKEHLREMLRAHWEIEIPQQAKGSRGESYGRR